MRDLDPIESSSVCGAFSFEAAWAATTVLGALAGCHYGYQVNDPKYGKAVDDDIALKWTLVGGMAGFVAPFIIVAPIVGEWLPS